MIRIVTDSGCDLPARIFDDLSVELVPLTVSFGDDSYLDRRDLTVEEFWQKLTTGTVVPQTAAPSVGQFTEVFQSLESSGASGIVVLCMSAAISATHQSATLAAASYPGVPVSVVDSRLVSGALGLVVMEAAEKARTGAGLSEVVETATEACAATSLYATLDTLEYLRRGGRIGGAAAFVGGLLDVKPIITFEGGEVTAAGRVRTRKRAVADVLDHLRSVSDRARRVGVIHSDAPEVDEVAAEIATIHGTQPLVIRVGPIVGTHAGPGVIGVTYRLG